MKENTKKVNLGRKVITGSSIRRSKILAAAATGQPNNQIAKELNISEPQVSKVLRLADSQEHLVSVIESLNDQLNMRLPLLLTTALDKLQTALNEPMVSFSDRMKCIGLVLQVATRLSELSIKSAKNN